ncbi:TSL-kinase interacting protein 1 isoform X2 [Amaranthus tricolor]|uniref:TSL-kinase interacting protein 1 isoform X2 n=1 Tax=Amaranthus tricolor TaxID=29722 RepID=UPI002585104B|nr:TSL-kinase interacting protein 1 isoform X2 [Amaranthus tricolor]
MQTAENAHIQCLEHHCAGNRVGQSSEPPIILSSSDDVTFAKPEKRQTRQWAAWTREEEECFFTALRQVGKNFEKITCRVQSKNKDQVRHYYYRLVRRMNKLLGPDLSLDAKNSKDTNAAMLRWWSLLEKYSCKASKLHLKPRRFKIFVEALEHQLMKDRKKNVKKRSLQGDSYSSPSPTTATNQNKLSGNDARAVKIILIDSQNVQKAGQARGSSRRNSNMGVIRSSNKGESSQTKSKQRRKTAALKRWEKAAMAGVSLVADAAEHLERTAGENPTANQGDSNCSEQTVQVHVQAKSSNITKGIVMEENAQANVKLTLQLFPIDESTRKGLELDKHNPHLELILSTRKKISSILEHLDRKWGTSGVASGELMLFPFNIQRENLLAYQRWSRDSAITAAEVYAMIGSPTVFRLRYGWIYDAELQSGISKTRLLALKNFNVQENRSKQALEDQSFPPTEDKDNAEKLVNHLLSNEASDKYGSAFEESTAAPSGHENMNADVDLQNNGFGMQSVGLRLLSNDACDDSTTFVNMKKVDQTARTSPSLSTEEWTDNLKNVAVRNHLTDVSDVMDADCVETPTFRSSGCLAEISFSCDSFDAAIAAHISTHNKIGGRGPSPHSSSIWDAEETCDAFSFQNRAVSNNQVSCSATAFSSASDIRCFTSSAGMDTTIQDSPKEVMDEDNPLDDQIDEYPSETREIGGSVEEFNSLTDVFWPDSLGPLELDVPSCKYYSEDLILSDSLSGLNRLLASSLDAFQNCTFFGLDDKRPSSTIGAQGGSSFAGKIDTSDKSGVQSLQV